MKIVKIIVGIIVVLAAIWLIGALFISNEYRVERSLEINAPPADVYAVVSDFSQRSAWDPWLAMEPAAAVTVTGEPGSKGATYHWKGEEIGEGKMTTLEMVTGKTIHSNLEFIEPMTVTCDVYWTFEPVENGTNVTWAFSGVAEYPQNFFNLMMDFNLGSQFEAGLANLKNKIEG